MTGRKYLTCPCPKCGNDAVIVRSWQSPSGYMRRKRCKSCELEFQTREEIVGGRQGAEIGISDTLILDALETAGVEIVRSPKFDDAG